MKTASARLSAGVLLGVASFLMTACGSDAGSSTPGAATGGGAGAGGAAGKGGAGGGAGKGGASAGTGGGAGKSSAGTGGASAGGASGGAAGTNAGGATAAGSGGTSTGGTTAAGNGGSASGTGGSGTAGNGTAGNGTAGNGVGGTGTGGSTQAGSGGSGDAGNAGSDAGGAGNAGTSAGGAGDAGSAGTSAGGSGNAGTSAGGTSAGSGGVAQGGSAGAGGGTPQRPNKMFVTSVSVDLATFKGRSEGDALCQKLADSAGLPNVDRYRVWLSDKTTDARQILGTARGWVRPDDLPFVDTVGDLSNGKIFYPPRLDEKGNDLGVDIKIITGTKEDGTKAANEICDGWVGTGNVRIGDGNRTTEAWTSSNSDACTGKARLSCFETTSEAPVAPVALPKTAHVIFVSRAVFAPGPKGRDQADEDCAKEAKAALLPGDYVALLPLAKEGALDRLPANDQPWFRPDGVLVAKSDLKQPRLVAPPNVTANGAGYLGSARTMVTGIVGSFLAEPALQCVAWTKAEGDPASGVATVTARANETDGDWHTVAVDTCNHEKASVYCVSKK